MAHADVDLKAPPRRRIGAVVLVRDRRDRVLMVKPAYGKRWQLPGGGAHADETIASAAARELKEETWLTLSPTCFVALDYVPFNPENEVAEEFNIVCYGGTLSDEDADAVTIPDVGELEAWAWVRPSELDDYCAPSEASRI